MKKRFLCALLAVIMLTGILAVGMPAAKAASELTASQELVDMLKSFEGFLKYPIWDNRQYSMGYGTYCSPDEYEYYKENGITEEEAEERLRYYTDRFGAVINSFCDKHGITMTQQQFDAMVCLSYNCGDGWVRETDGVLYNALVSGATGAELLYAFSLWSKSSSYNTKGLIERRMAEGNLYLNGVYGTKMPDNYAYVLFDANGGMVNYTVQGYSKDEPAPILVEPAESITGTNGAGQTDTYTFDGWYTAISGGTKIETLDGSLANGTTLYAHWKDSNGNVVTPPEPDTEEIDSVTVSVTGTEVRIRQGPGTGYAQVGVADKGQSLTITHLSTDKNGEKWGKFGEEQWICLRYTNYGTSGEEGGDSSGETGGEEVTGVTGIINVSDFLNIRSGPGTGYDAVGSYPGGARVTILEQKTVGADVWGRTDKGWISMAYVKLDPTGETTPPTTVPPTTVPPTTTQPPTTVPPTTVPPTTVPPTTVPPTTVPPTTTAPETQPPYESWQGTVQVNDSLIIRSGPGTYNSIKGYLLNGDVVTVLEEKTVDGMRWGRIEKGWISLKYVVEGIIEETEPPTTVPPTTIPPATVPPTTVPPTTVPPTTVPPTTVPPAVEPSEPVVGEITGKWAGQVSAESVLYIRSQPGTSGKVVGNLMADALVTITRVQSVDGKVWGKVDKGWVCLDFVSIDGMSTMQTPADTASESVTKVLEEPVTMTVNTCSLRVRKSAGVTGGIVGYLPLGSDVEILETKSIGSATWGRTDSGWVNLKYLKEA